MFKLWVSNHPKQGTVLLMVVDFSFLLWICVSFIVEWSWPSQLVRRIKKSTATASLSGETCWFRLPQTVGAAWLTPPNPLVLKWLNVLLMDFTSKATQVPKLSIWCPFRCWFWSHFCWTLANDLLKHVQAGSFAYSGALFASMTIIEWSVEMVPLLPAMLQLWLVRQRKETLENCGGCIKHQGFCLKVHPFSSLWKTTSGRLKVIS